MRLRNNQWTRDTRVGARALNRIAAMRLYFPKVDRLRGQLSVAYDNKNYINSSSGESPQTRSVTSNTRISPYHLRRGALHSRYQFSRHGVYLTQSAFEIVSVEALASSKAAAAAAVRVGDLGTPDSCREANDMCRRIYGLHKPTIAS